MVIFNLIDICKTLIAILLLSDKEYKFSSSQDIIILALLFTTNYQDDSLISVKTWKDTNKATQRAKSVL